MSCDQLLALVSTRPELAVSCQIVLARRHDPYKFPFTLRLVDIDDRNRGRSVAHCLHQMSSPD